MVYNTQPSRRRSIMAITLHHLISPAKDKRASAQLFAEIFGLTVKPSEGRFAQVPLDEHLTIDFADDERTRGILHFVPDQLESHHYAFHVTDEEFDGIFGRVQAKGLAYGSGPTTETDGQVADRRGGRVFYFRELNGHLLEVMTAQERRGTEDGRRAGGWTISVESRRIPKVRSQESSHALATSPARLLAFRSPPAAPTPAAPTCATGPSAAQSRLGSGLAAPASESARHCWL